jgi:glyoxylase-like metal-dependent hydrolase (beta-lactamase superfamily II)
MRTVVRWIAGIFLPSAALVPIAGAQHDRSASARTGRRPELEYLEAVNREAPPADPQLLFLLMAQYANANRHAEGAEFFAARLKEFEPRLSDPQRSLYLAAIGALRAGHAKEVPLWRRFGWVKDTIAILEDANALSGGKIYVVRWMSGVVNVEVPGFFGRKDVALEDLTWCLEHADEAPHAGWLREVYYHLASIYQRDGIPDKARDYLRRSGFTDFNKGLTFTTGSAEDLATGHTFSPKRIAEVVPGKVFALSGFEFTEYYFVVSENGRELIAIDAGTRPDSARAAYEALRAHAPGVPQLTTVFITHSHWDHVGGHAYFRTLNPQVKFYARENYSEELARSIGAPDLFAKPFFGERFSLKDVESFRPDVTIERDTELTIGDTRFELIPIAGGETSDGMFIHLPDHRVLFAGDFIMPYLGAPFVVEGSLDGLLGAIDIAERKSPRIVLHGHEPLSRVFGSVETLVALRPHLVWLRAQVLAAIRRGESRAAIQQANLIPPGLLESSARVHLPFLIVRENVINRLYDQNVGYWQPDLQGVDYLDAAERGAVLVDYLHVSEAQLAKAVRQMITDGRYELAASTLESVKGRFAPSGPLGDAARLAYLKLMEKYQEFNPFKFIIYCAKAGTEVPQMAVEGAAAAPAARSATGLSPRRT